MRAKTLLDRLFIWSKYKKYIYSYDVFFWTFYSNIITSKKRIIILSNK